MRMIGSRRLIILGAAVLALASRGVSASDTAQYRIADGFSIYLGVLPAQMVAGHPPGHPEATMHDGAPAGEHSYHLMIAVFEADSGARVSDLEATARVSALGLVGPRRTLEPMEIAGAITFGNYFELSGGGPYRIDVEFRRVGAAEPVQVRFQYAHP